jgi:hypothetical protein
MITLWGPTSAGKTALLSYLHLRSQATDSGWHIYPTGESTLKEIVRQTDQILKGNEFPLGTQSTTEQMISYDFKDRATGALFRMETTDRAGILSVVMDDVLLNALVESEGIVLLLDSNREHCETEVINALIHIYVRYIEKGKGGVGEPDARPFAVCLSKVDQFIRTAEDLKRLQDKPEEFVQDHLSPELLRQIQQYHSTVKYFPVSSVGLRLSYGCIQKSVFYDEKLVLRVTSQGTPLNIIEPFVWIFEKLRASA